MSIRITPRATVTVPTEPATPELPTAALMTTPLPVNDLGTCGDCGSEMTALLDNEGKVRTAFCEYCEFS